MITINLRYSGINGNALKFAEEMEKSGIANKIRAEKGNLRYEYYLPLNDSETVLLIDSWENHQALDNHHKSPMMTKIAELREKYDLHMTAERFISAPENEIDDKYIRQ
ncbi:MAG: antibiotic biosynthesis monooxygenase [Clostridia bacterium]|nr:antibiotic biosynthesis monooxygenase [Clostridia bacterium]